MIAPTSTPLTPTPLHLTIFGASRGIGREAVRQALAAGHEVTAVSRDPSALGEHRDAVRIVRGDARAASTVDRALTRADRRPVDAVLCALGAPAFSDSKIRTEGTRAIVAGMHRAQVARIAAVSLMGAAETRAQLPFFYRNVLFPLYLRKPVAEHEEQERILSASSLDWTVVRPPNLNDGPVTNTYTAGVFDDWSQLNLSVSRADVAHFLLRCLARGEFLRQAPVVSQRKEGARAA